MKRGTLLLAFIAAIFTQTAFAETEFPTTGNKLVVYPDPVLLDTRIALKEPSGDIVYVAVMNMAGRIVTTNKYVPGTSVLYLDMSTLPVGQYNVQVSGAAIATTYLKVFKQ